jgi:hypothetical protein
MVAGNLVSMSEKEKLIDTLTCPNSILFLGNHSEVSAIKEQFANLKRMEINGNTIWFLNDQPNIANTKIKVYPTGHMVFYNSEGKRFLFTDPEGHPLHECEWKKDEISGETRLAFVRMQLDCRQWFGIKPRAKTFSTRLDIKGHPGWENMTLDDLRKKAAEAWKIPLAEVEYFYKDSNFEYLGEGQYNIYLSKDGLYVLPDGTSEAPVSNYSGGCVTTIPGKPSIHLYVFEACRFIHPKRRLRFFPPISLPRAPRASALWTCLWTTTRHTGLPGIPFQSLPGDISAMNIQYV